MANLSQEVIGVGKEGKRYYHTDPESGFEVFWMSAIRLDDMFGEEAWIKFGLPALRKKDRNPAGLSEIDRMYYDKCLSYLDGDLSWWGYWKIYGTWGFIEQKPAVLADPDAWFKFSAYSGRVTKAWAEYGQTLDKLRDEYLPRIVSGEAGVDSFHEFVAEWYKHGGEAETREVNAWYAKRKKATPP